MGKVIARVFLLLGMVAAGALVVAPVQAAPLGDQLIIAGEQGGGRIVILDPDVADWDDPSAIVWEWQPTAASGFSAAEIAAFGNVTDFELRQTAEGWRMAVTASLGLAAVIDYPSGDRVWAQVLPTSANLHGVELLPNGNVAISSTNTTNGWVRVYAASQGPSAATYAEHSLSAQAHQVLWDPLTERLWFVGKEGSASDDPRILSALAVTGTAANPRLTEDTTKWHELPDIGSHDLTADPSDPDVLLVALDSTAWEFDKNDALSAFTQIPAVDGGLAKLKAISRQPSGQTVITRPDEYKSPKGACAVVNYWCTDTVEFFGPDATRSMTGAQFYRARAMNTDYSAVGDTLHGPASDRTLASGGSWSSPVEFHAEGTPSTLAAAALPDDTLHAFLLVPGDGVWARVRSSAGTWSAATKIDANGSISAIAATGLSDGTVHLQTVVPGSGVWDRTRSATGAWSAATKIDGNGAITAVSSAAVSSTLHVQTLVPGAGVWNRTRDTAGVWSSSAKAVDGCDGTGANAPCITDISSAALPDGTLHVQTLTPARGVDDVTRSPAGVWSAPVAIDANDGITRISATTLSDGTLHVQTIVPGFGLWDRTRGGSGSWSAASKVTADEDIFDVYGAGLSGAELHIGTARFER